VPNRAPAVPWQSAVSSGPLPNRTIPDRTANTSRHLHVHIGMRISHLPTSPPMGAFRRGKGRLRRRRSGYAIRWAPGIPHTVMPDQPGAEPAGRCDAESMAMVKDHLSGMEWNGMGQSGARNLWSCANGRH
jgi:hypothetical protein